MKRNQYEIRNQADDTVELLIYGIVGSYWDELYAKDIVTDLKNTDAKTIVVRIYSDGGSVFAGLAIYNALKAHPAKIEVKIDSLAASIASVIAMAGAVEMPENAFLMIHDPWGWVSGTASDMTKMAGVLAKIKNSLVTVYEDKTGMGADKIAEMMTDETWMNAAEAVDLGFADTITGAAEPQNMAVFNSLKDFKKVPEQLKGFLNKTPGSGKPPAKKQEVSDMEITVEVLKNKYPDVAKALIDEGREAGTADGASGERERIQAVREQSMPGHEALINTLMFDGETTGEQAAVQVLRAEKKLRADAQANLQDDAVPPVNAAVPGDDAQGDDAHSDLPVDERAKAKWDNDAKLRNEFDSDFDAYLAYFKANDAGQVKFLRNKRA